jgi:hypothetical protein
MRLEMLIMWQSLVAGHLAELESTAWKDDRRFRVLVADAGALSFADLYLNTPTKVSWQQVVNSMLPSEACMRI